MRKIMSLVVCAFALCFVCMTVYAHSGRTDSDGGHYDQSTGEYHYHHGYPAHDHYDMDGDGIPDCPYDFEDKTGQSSGSSSGSRTSQSTNSVSVQYTLRKDVKDVPDWVYWLYWVIGILAFFVICLFISNKRKKDAIKQLKANYDREIGKEKEQKEKYESQINDIKKELAGQEHTYEIKLEEYKERLRIDVSSIDKSFKSVRGSDYLYYLVGAPDGDTVGPDDLPRSQDGTKYEWGEKYTFYVAFDSKSLKFHTANCTHKGGIPVNAYFLSRNYIHTPCKLCNPKLPNLSWYIRYRDIMDFQSKYLETDLQRQEKNRRNRTN